MSQLFIRLYLDEDVDILVADLIRARGYTVTTTQEADTLSRNDADQLLIAKRQLVIKTERTCGCLYLVEAVRSDFWPITNVRIAMYECKEF